jgi:predicted Rdx family selenoprotein
VTIVPNTSTEETLLWDRKRDGGFPGTLCLHTLCFLFLGDVADADGIVEVKQLKALVRNIVDPTRNLGHVDRALNKANKDKEDVSTTESKEATKPESSAEQQQVVVVVDATTTAAAAQTSEKEGNPPVKSQEVCEDCQ